LIWPEISELLDGADVGTGFPHRSADALIGTFIAGHLLLLSQRSSNADMEKLEIVDEVWALCFRAPRPGWRLLGRFLEPRVFVGLRLYERHQLGSRKKYSAKANEVINDWNKALGSIPPFRANALGTYVGGVFRDVDGQEED